MKKTTQIITNITFWLLIFTVQFLLSSQFVDYEKATYFATGNVFFQASLFYIISQVLFPLYFNKGFVKTFVLLNILTLVFIATAQSFVEIWVSQFVEQPVHKPDRPEFFIVFRAFNWLLLVDFVATTFGLYRHVKEREIYQKKLSEEKLSTEIKLLKAQINPHFVFNALNNIYSMTYMKHDKAPESVLKLSQMLRYVFDDCSKDLVPLSSEVTYIENFIGFQQMKSPHEQHITFETDIQNPTIEIAPMLMIPFLENSFKFSRIEETQDAEVDIKLSIDSNSLMFSVSNTFNTENRPASGSGMGIKNVQDRLQLIYPGKHQLDIKKDKGLFSVLLKIRLS